MYHCDDAVRMELPLWSSNQKHMTPVWAWEIQQIYCNWNSLPLLLKTGHQKQSVRSKESIGNKTNVTGCHKWGLRTEK